MCGHQIASVLVDRSCHFSQGPLFRNENGIRRRRHVREYVSHAEKSRTFYAVVVVKEAGQTCSKKYVGVFKKNKRFVRPDSFTRGPAGLNNDRDERRVVRRGVCVSPVFVYVPRHGRSDGAGPPKTQTPRAAPLRVPPATLAPFATATPPPLPRRPYAAATATPTPPRLHGTPVLRGPSLGRNSHAHTHPHTPAHTRTDTQARRHRAQSRPHVRRPQRT